jgi:hypothetical protein
MVIFYWYPGSNRKDLSCKMNSRSGFSHKTAFLAFLLVSIVLSGVLSGVGTVKGNLIQTTSRNRPTPIEGSGDRKNPNKSNAKTPIVLGMAYLDLNQLADANSIDEADNARWSLVRGTKSAKGIYSTRHGVNWDALRVIEASGTFLIPAGSSWSFNKTFRGGVGYKYASGVYAGGHCALATLFRAAAMHAGLPNRAKPHSWPVPGFNLNETVSIWWGRDDLVLHNPTRQDLQLVWNLSVDGIDLSVIGQKD